MTQPTEALDRLWASTIVQCSFDLATQSIRLELAIESESATEGHVLQFHEVRDLRFVNSIPSPWSYAEATEIHITNEGREVVVSLVLWSEDAELRVKCGRVLLDGKRIAGLAQA